MSQTDPIEVFPSPASSEEPAALAGTYLRDLAQSLSKFDDFGSFLESLSGLIEADRYLNGSAKLVDLDDAAGLPDFDVLDPDEVVLAVAGSAGACGHLKYSGRGDGRLFDAGDLHLMGSLAALLSSLIAQASRYRNVSQAHRVLQYLVNQLPLGVVCFDMDETLIVQSRLAERLLGESGAEQLKSQLAAVANNPKRRYQAHIEIDSHLLYVEGRLLPIDAGAPVSAFVLYDMSSSKERLDLELERGVYLSASTQEPHTVALLEDRSEPGRIYRELKRRVKEASFAASSVTAVDAYSCMCTFEGHRQRSVRYLLGHALSTKSFPELSVSLLGPAEFAQAEAPAAALLESAKAGLQPAAQLLRPKLLILDVYPAVSASLQLLAGERCSIQSCEDPREAQSLLASGCFDGLFVDLELCGSEYLGALSEAAVTGGAGIKLVYTSCLHAASVREVYGLSARDVVLHKPFDVSVVEELLAVQFDLS